MAEFTFKDAMALRGITPGEPRPTVTLVGKNGNIHNLRMLAADALRRAGASRDHIARMQAEIEESESYEDALAVIMRYVDAH